MSVLATKKLIKRFGGVQALDHVDVSFEEGVITALIGPNGSGKTTLINVLTGMVPFDSGTVVLSDAIQLSRIVPSDIASYGITRTFQSVRLIGQMSVLDNMLLVLTERNVWGALSRRYTQVHLDQAEDLLRSVDLWEKRGENAERLSYGQRKLLEIARARAMKARIYFFDEPFAGLFKEMALQVSEMLRQLRAEGAAVVLVEHNMDVIRDLADDCYVLDSGKVIAHGTPERVLREPAVIEAYLGK